MNQNDTVMKLEALLQSDAAKREQFLAEEKRVLENKEAATAAEAMVKAAAGLDIVLTVEEAQRALAEMQDLSDEELEAVSAGSVLDEVSEAAGAAGAVADAAGSYLGIGELCWKNYNCVTVWKNSVVGTIYDVTTNPR